MKIFVKKNTIFTVRNVRTFFFTLTFSIKKVLLTGMQEYSSRQNAIAWGVVLLVLVPIAIGIVFLAFKYVKKNNIDVYATIRKKR